MIFVLITRQGKLHSLSANKGQIKALLNEPMEYSHLDFYNFWSKNKAVHIKAKRIFKKLFFCIISAKAEIHNCLNFRDALQGGQLSPAKNFSLLVKCPQIEIHRIQQHA
jgi:thermostable 8-oxoguanine DNA glycosylase